MGDPLHWWPGKNSDHKRIAELIDTCPTSANIIVFGGRSAFAELLPRHRVLQHRLQPAPEISPLPFDDDSFDFGISAGVLEFLPESLRKTYIQELLRVCRQRIFVSLPMQPELEVIDSLKNRYIWDTSRVWARPAMQPAELEALLQDLPYYMELHPELGYVDEDLVDLYDLEDLHDPNERFAPSELPACEAALLLRTTTSPFLIAEISLDEYEVAVVASSMVDALN